MVYNIESSKLKYNFLNYTFYFSSNLYLKKFSEGLKDYIDREKQDFYNKYNEDLLTDDFLAIQFYKKIEKRGFRMYYNNERMKHIEYKIVK